MIFERYCANLSLYLNEILSDRLSQSEHFNIRQVYISKLRGEEVPNLNQTRPISITSPVLKLMEVILKVKLDRMEGVQVQNNSQIGFKRHMDCGMNIYRLLQEVKSYKKMYPR